MAHSTTGKEPIFILSCYRSGSTLLRYIFDTHPDVYSPPELGLGETAFRLAHLDSGLIGMQVEPNRPDQYPAEIIAGIRATLGTRMDAAAARKGKRRWCEKSPDNLATIDLLRLVFPEARFVCLYRHAFDMAKSLIHKMIHSIQDLRPFLIAHKGHLESAALDYWNQRVVGAMVLEAEVPERCARVRYEDMVANPAEVLRPVFTSHGLSWDEKLIESVFTVQHDRGMEDHYAVLTRSIHSDSVGGGRDLSLDGVPQKVLDSTRQLLKMLGYPDLPQTARNGRPAAATVTATPLWLFETYLAEKARTQLDLLKAIGSSYRFDVSGEGGGTWVIDPQQETIFAGQAPATCKIEISAADLFAIAHGRLHPYKAGEEGRLQFHGNINLRELEALVRFLYLSPA
jgi:hypothetical protein